METSFRTKEKPMFRCETCNYKTESERGLKVHIKRKHENLQDKFPQSCDFCEYKAHSKSSLEDHLKEHTYKELKFKCEDCDFLVNDILSLDIHVGRKHSGNFECAICGFKAKSEDNLNIHLHTCETFSCDYCWDPKVTVNNLTDLVTHLKEKHPKHLKNTNITHTKMDRNDTDKVSQRTVCSSFLIKNIN